MNGSLLSWYVLVSTGVFSDSEHSLNRDLKSESRLLCKTHILYLKDSKMCTLIGEELKGEKE